MKEKKSIDVLASNLGFLFWILSHSSDFSPKLQDKIWNGKPGFEAIDVYAYCRPKLDSRKAWKQAHLAVVQIDNMIQYVLLHNKLYRVFNRLQCMHVANVC